MSCSSAYRDLVSGRWQGPLAAGLRLALGVAERPYGWAVRRRNRRFDRGLAAVEHVAAPVISVGNLTVGGTGKTPLVAWLAQWLTEQQIAVTIISRGYGGRRGRPNDEALELLARLPQVPHIQDADRVEAARQALAANPRQVLLLDDGFQHRRLARDLDIVLLDAIEPFGYGRLLPRGLLREPVECLVRADVVALSRSDAVDPARRCEIEARVRRLAPQAVWAELMHQPTELITAGGQRLALGERENRPVAAFCGIGNPAGFRHTLATSGIQVASFLELPDHCLYDARRLARLESWLGQQRDCCEVICTRKDLVKIPRKELAGKKLWALAIELRIVRGLEELEAALKRAIRALVHPQAK